MTCSSLIFAKEPSLFEIESRHTMVKDYEYYKTPVDEAVQAVREAQDSVGKDIWNDKE